MKQILFLTIFIISLGTYGIHMFLDFISPLFQGLLTGIWFVISPVVLIAFLVSNTLRGKRFLVLNQTGINFWNLLSFLAHTFMTSQSMRELYVLTLNTTPSVRKEYRDRCKKRSQSLLGLLHNLHGRLESFLAEFGNATFQLSETTRAVARSIVSENESDYDKAYALFTWITKNITYAPTTDADASSYRNSEEVFRSRTGICGEMSYLLVAFCGVVGVKASWVAVYVDFEGEEVNHACVAIETKEGIILADPAYQKWDVKHRVFTIHNHEEVIKTHTMYRYQNS